MLPIIVFGQRALSALKLCLLYRTRGKMSRWFPGFFAIKQKQPRTKGRRRRRAGGVRGVSAKQEETHRQVSLRSLTAFFFDRFAMGGRWGISSSKPLAWGFYPQTPSSLRAASSSFFINPSLGTSPLDPIIASRGFTRLFINPSPDVHTSPQERPIRGGKGTVHHDQTVTPLRPAGQAGLSLR